jgi:hypothetical protein
MSRFDAYRASFPNGRLTRSKSGVLEVAFHTDGGTLVFDGHIHEQFVDLFHVIASDPDNRVVILTGSGNAFMETLSPEGLRQADDRGLGTGAWLEQATSHCRKHCCSVSRAGHAASGERCTERATERCAESARRPFHRPGAGASNSVGCSRTASNHRADRRQHDIGEAR